MFTGLVEEGGVVASVAPGGEGARLVIAASAVLDGLEVGDSVAVNGACLTVGGDHGRRLRRRRGRRDAPPHDAGRAGGRATA